MIYKHAHDMHMTSFIAYGTYLNGFQLPLQKAVARGGGSRMTAK